MRCVSALLMCVCVVLFCNACGGGSSSSSTTDNVTVTLTPLTVDVPLGEKQQFTATTYGSTDTGIIWYVNGVEGGNSAYGTITQSGLYTAPTVVPDPSTVTVTATSHANSADIANAAVHITSGITVSLSPSVADLQLGGTQQFNASVSGASDNSVIWKVGGVTGGNATVGTISTSGLYTAPASGSTPLSVSVTAGSTVDPTKTASASVTVHSAMKVDVSPNPASVATYGTLQFLAAVTGNTNTAVTWRINGVNGGTAATGTISASGLYIAPRSVPTVTGSGTTKTTTVTMTAVSQADSSVYGSTVLTVYAANQKQQTTPTLLGVSGGNVGDSTGTSCCGGTLGALVTRGGKQYILSTAHVLAPSSTAKVGDNIVQPGLLDSSCSTTDTSTVASLSQFTNLQGGASIDAALAEVVDGKVDSQGAIMQLGSTTSNGTPADAAPHGGVGIAPAVNMSVAKSGRSTGLTCSTIDAIHVTMALQYENGCGSGQTYQVVLNNLVDIFGVGFSAEGDSGSLVVSRDTADPVGLLVASTDADTVAAPVSDVLANLSDPNTGESPVFVGTADTHAVVGCSTTTQSSSSITVPAEKLSSATSVRDLYAPTLLAHSGVRAVGVGSSYDQPGDAAIIVFVANGESATDIPAQVGGIRTRIVEVAGGKRGVLSAAQTTSLTASAKTTPTQLSKAEISRAASVQNQHIGELLKMAGVQGVGVSQSGDHPSEAALVIFTVQGEQHNAIPAVIDGVRTRVRETSRFQTSSGAAAQTSCKKLGVAVR